MKICLSNGSRLHCVVIASALCAAAAIPAAAQWRPERNVEIIVGTGPGGGQDKTARTLQRIVQELKLLPVPASVVNKPGGGGAVGWTYLNQHAADAHYVEVGNPTLLTNHIIGRSAISYTDFTPLAVLFTESVAISVRADSPIRSGRDLLDRLRQDSASVSFSVGSSLGSANHIAMGELARLSGADTKRLKAVVFQGGGEAMTALLGGHVDLIASAANNVVPHIAAGKIRVLGITAPHRLVGPLGAVPTWREQGVDVTTNNWRMVAGAKSLAAPQIAYWEDVLRRATETEAWKADLERNGFENMFMTHEPALAFLKSQSADLRRALAEIGMAK
jgi:putative tricarboxylic transport membrane protein